MITFDTDLLRSFQVFEVFDPAETMAHLMLTRLPNNYSDRLAAPAGGAVPKHLRRAETCIAAHAAQPMALADIAAAAGCGLRTLHSAFRQFRDTTPLAALKDARLREVRAALLAPEDGETSSSIARRFGFTNSSRFNATYLRRFGETPRQTHSLP